MNKFLTVCTMSVAALAMSACTHRSEYRDTSAAPAPAYYDNTAYEEPAPAPAVHHMHHHKMHHNCTTKVITKTVDANGNVIKTTTSKE